MGVAVRIPFPVGKWKGEKKPSFNPPPAETPA